MAAGSRSRLLSPNTPYLTSLNRLRTRSPSDLQDLCCKALIK